MSIRLILFFIILFPSILFAAETKIYPTEPVDQSAKIMGGVEALPGAWPWIAALLKSNQPDTYQAQFCSGTLIEKNWVLTAAHCIDDLSTKDIQVAVGAYNLDFFTGIRTPVKRIIIHSRYDRLTLHNDIALIELSYPSNIKPITLFSEQSNDNTPPNLIGRIVTVLGWGLADATSWYTTDWYYPTKLRQVNLPVVEDSYCNDIYTVDNIPSEFCAGYYEGKDACVGDSGGPTLLQVDGKWVHAGIVSSGVPCDSYYGWYGVYTRTSAHIQFIKQYVPNVSVTTRNLPPIGGILPSINLLLLDP